LLFVILEIIAPYSLDYKRRGRLKVRHSILIFQSQIKKRVFLFSLGISIGLFILISNGFANRCRLKRQNERNVCLSNVEDTDYYCRFVYDIALNHMCYAIAQRKLRACTVITDPEIKKRCEDGVQAKRILDEERLKKQEEIAKKEALKQERLAKKKQKNSNQPQTQK
jgi:hypothetical protein